MRVRQMFETLWSEYRPYADSQFPTKFAVETEQRFWEMYLTCYLLEHGKHVIPRDDPRIKGKDDCPDIAIDDGSRIVWVEAVAPTSGDPNYRNSVPPLATNSPEDEEFSAHTVNPELIVLRVTSALKDKGEQITKYREQGLIHPNDLSIIAISIGRMGTSSIMTDVIEGARAVYPIGNQYVTVNVASGEPVDSGRARSQSIQKVTIGGGTTPIPQTAFLDGAYDQISGLIWSTMSIGRLLCPECRGLRFIYNLLGPPLPGEWISWRQELIPMYEDQRFLLTVR